MAGYHMLGAWGGAHAQAIQVFVSAASATKVSAVAAMKVSRRLKMAITVWNDG